MKICQVMLAALLGGCLFVGEAVSEEGNDRMAMRQKAAKAQQEGNFKDAYESFRKLALDRDNDPKRVGDDLNAAIACLQRLARFNEIDALREAAIDTHKDNWRLLWTAAQSYMHVEHFGFMIAGQFERGQHRGGGKVVNSVERDRIRALQLMQQALPKAKEDDVRGDVGHFLLSLSDMLLNHRGYSEAWRLQYLSDLTALPDYDDGWGYHRETPGAPVDADGAPVFHHAPRTWEEATTDGQRWRWALEQATEFSPPRKNEVRLRFADFLSNQFGPQTMAYYGAFFGRMPEEGDESGAYALHTLAEDETIARLAIGIKRFKLPDEFNYIRVLQKVVDEPQTGNAIEALERLANEFLNRRQYAKAADHYRRLVKDHGNEQQKKNWRQQLEQIVDNWGRFEPIVSQPAGQGATVEYRFRNGSEIELTAREIHVETLLDDVKAYLKSNPKQLDWQKLDIGNIGYRLVEQDQEKYIGNEVAKWKMMVNPRPNHFDKRVTVATPLTRAGAYFVTATMAGGNTSHIIIWVADTTIVKKPLDQQMYYFVADAASGAPVAKANVEFFGYQQQWRENPPRHELTTRRFAEFTDADGQLFTDAKTQPQDYQWIVIARTDKDKGGRFAFLGYTHAWYQARYDDTYAQTKVYAITDRPVYRPEQTVKFKFWIGHAKYDVDDNAGFAERDFWVEIHNPKGEKIYEKTLKSDQYGGIADEIALPADATLGVYQTMVFGSPQPEAGPPAKAGIMRGLGRGVARAVAPAGRDHLGGGSFRVEEYKKPEYEVTVDAPSEPVMLGEKIAATINAKYYFGSPVTKAKVKYKVTRTGQTEPWYPIAPWDWFYGRGYWWFGYDYHWYPGWSNWGCPRPFPFWWPRGHQPPELVADAEAEIGEDGTLKVEIDTAVAKAIHPNLDHSYEITAEVVDQSRRTIVGTGKVLVARKPFSVYAWVDRGYYRVGETVHAHMAAHTLDNKPVQGKGELTLLRISYKKGKPVETPEAEWKVDTNAEGRAYQALTASRAGQYRLSYKVTDAKGHTIEGGYVFTVIGEGFDGSEFRFNALELVPDKRDYQPGEKVQLQVNTNRTGSTVLLFEKPTNGVYQKPRVIRLDGKSALAQIEVVKRDMPNFFVEAMTVADGKVHQEMKELAVPPEKRVLGVEIEPSATAYKPGEKAKVKLKLTDFEGEPFVGSTVVAIYDKSVEYIAGGSNVGDIKEFFWKWRRQHHPQAEHTLDRWSYNLTPKNTPGVNNLGMFGETVATEMDEMQVDGTANGAMKGLGGGFGGGGMMVQRTMAMPLAEGAAMPMAAPAPAMDMAAEAAPMDAAGAAMEKGGPAGGEGGGAAMVEPTVRSNFADTALWVAALTTDKDGTAEVELDMPENLTTWRIKVWGMGQGTRVGEGVTDVVTRKDLIVRMQTPRFFVQKDEVVLSANVHNYLTSKKAVRVVLELDGAALEPMGELTQSVEIDSQGEARVDWRVRVVDEGTATVRMKALTDEDSDAMEMKIPCHIHGMLKMEAYSGVIRPKDETGKFAFTVPEERRPLQSRLEVRYSPTLAGAMVDALPYMVDYPYGCTEQTLNRFLPTVITQKILIEMGIDLEAVKQKQTNLNAQEIGDDRQRAEQWQRYDRNPVFDAEEVKKMVKDGVERLTQMQLSDGGWGWFSGWGEHSTPHTTSLVVHGLQIAQQNDVALVPGVLDRGVAWLKRHQDEQVKLLENAARKDKPHDWRWKDSADNLDAFVYMVLVDADVKNDKMKEFLYRDRTNLAVYSMAIFGLALEKQGDREKLDMVMRNIGQFVEQDDENQTAWLRLPEGYWWYWYGSEYEAHAYYLKLLSRTEPKGELASRLVKYLLNNRKHATYWNSTRDTAICVEAMADFLRASGESKPEMTLEVHYDGKLQKAVEITPQTLFTFDNKFVLDGKQVEAGKHEVELRKKGQGPLYFNGYVTNFTLEDFITKAGLEIKVERRYFKLVKADKEIHAAGARGQVVGQKVEKYERQPLENLALLKSGDLCEIELVIESKNDYEYIVFEDMKPAGFEPVDLRSGYTGNEMGAYVEFRDNRVAMFVRALARGKHSMSYRMRAEIPGQFSALPTRAWAMYAPELKANSDEIKLKVED
jgi:hypothetical protein